MFRCVLIKKYLNYLRIPSSSVHYQSQGRDQIFYNLINHYNRKNGIHIDLMKNAIRNINSRISERMSLVILSSAARSVHSLPCNKRAELLDQV